MNSYGGIFICCKLLLNNIMIIAILIIFIVIVTTVLLTYFIFLNFIDTPLPNCTNDDDVDKIDRIVYKTKDLKKSIYEPDTFNTITIINNLNPFNDAIHFQLVLEAIQQWVYLYFDPNSKYYRDLKLYENINYSLLNIYNRLPKPPPNQQFPWGNNWYPFTITMMDTFLYTYAAYKVNHIRNDMFKLMIIDLGNNYLPTPTTSMGWSRNSGNVFKMFYNFIYYNILNKKTIKEILNSRNTDVAVNTVNMTITVAGNGINVDLSYIDHENVRAYGYLRNSLYTFELYNYILSISYKNPYICLNKVVSRNGCVNPALFSRNGRILFKNMADELITQNEYSDGLFSCDNNKILTIKTKVFFLCILGQRNQISYYESDQLNNTLAGLWLFSKRLYLNNVHDQEYIENNLVVTNEPGVWAPIPLHRSTSTTTTSFTPTFAVSTCMVLKNCGVLFVDCKIDNVCNFVSLSIVTPTGLYQKYSNVKITRENNAPYTCCIMEGESNNIDLIRNTKTFYNDTLVCKINSYQGTLTHTHNNGRSSIVATYTEDNVDLEYIILLNSKSLNIDNITYVKNNITVFDDVYILIDKINTNYIVYMYDKLEKKLAVADTSHDNDNYENKILNVNITNVKLLEPNTKAIAPVNCVKTNEFSYKIEVLGVRTYIFNITL
nr:odv-e66 [Pieris rapae granulovirus]AGS18802.1 odv-e66 [Pieris rapae granulovirus]